MVVGQRWRMQAAFHTGKRPATWPAHAACSMQLSRSQLLVDMPLLLLIYMRQHFDPHRTTVSDQPGLGAGHTSLGYARAGVMMLMTRLWLLSKVMEQPTVLLSELLGFIDVNDNEMTLCVPGSGFMIGTVSGQMGRAEFSRKTASIDTVWAYVALSETCGMDGWMFLRREPEGKLVCIQLQSKKQTETQAVKPASEPGAGAVVKMHGLQHVLLVVTDRDEPEQRCGCLCSWSFRGPRSHPVIVRTPAEHNHFYGGCEHLLTAAMHRRQFPDSEQR